VKGRDTLKPRGKAVIPFVWLCLFIWTPPGEARIYRYVDSDGVIHLTNRMGEVKTTPADYTSRARILRIIEEMARDYRLSPSLVKAIIKVESDFNPLALSPKGAMGLMQLMPEVVRRYGLKDPFDIQENIRAGINHLAYLLEHYHQDLELVLAAYNAGQGAVDHYGGVPPFAETREFIRRVLYHYQRWNSKERETEGKRRIYRILRPGGLVLFTNVGR